MASYYHEKAKLRSMLAVTIRLLLFIQAYSSIFAGILSFCFYIKSSEAKNFSKITSNGKNHTESLQEAEAEKGKK